MFSTDNCQKIITSVICIKCRRNMIVRTIQTLVSMRPLDGNTPGVNMILFTECFACLNDKLEMDMKMSMDEMMLKYTDTVTDIYKLISPDLRLTYRVSAKTTEELNRSRIVGMPWIWDVNPKEWDIVILRISEVAYEITRSIFSISSIDNGVEGDPWIDFFPSNGSELGKFRLGPRYNAVRHTMVCCMCTDLRHVVTKLTFWDREMHFTEVATWILITCCKHCESRYNPSYPEMLKETNSILNHEKTPLKRIIKKSGMDTMLLPQFVDRETVMNSFEMVHPNFKPRIDGPDGKRTTTKEPFF